MAKASTDKGKGKAIQMPGAVRSRRGCLVCRRRHKKCDEQIEDGSCERCRVAGLECLLPPAESRTRYSGPSYNPGKRQIRAASPAAHGGLFGTTPEARSNHGARHSSESPLAGPSTYADVPARALNLEPLGLVGTIDETLGFLPLLASSSSTLTPAPTESSALALFGTHLPDIPAASTWDPFSDCFVSSPSTADTQQPPSPGAFLRSWPGNGGGMSASATDFLRSIQPWTDAAFGHLPPLHFNAASTRLAMNALTHKYISPDTPLTQDIYKLIHNTWFIMPQQPTYYDAMSARSGTSKLARDLVVKAFEALVPSESDEAQEGLQESTYLYEQAVQRLVSCADMRLDDRMHIISDLQLFSFAASGAKQAYEAVDLADDFFRALGSEEQVSAFLQKTLVDPKQEAALKLFIGMDLCRAICRPRSRPFLPLLKLYATAAENEAAHMVLFPFELSVVLSHICHLQGATLTPAEVQAETAAMEPDIMLVNEERASRPWVVRIWKLAVRALLYQRIRRVGPLHPVLQSIAADLRREFDRYKPGESAVEKALSLPLFIAGTLALAWSDRDIIQAHWTTLKPERGWQEPIALLQRIWTEMDQTGDTVRWEEVVLKENWSIAFF